MVRASYARPASVGPLRTLLRSLANPHSISAQILTSMPPPAHLPMGTPVFRHDANFDSNGHTLDGSVPRMPAHIDVNGMTVDASGSIPAIGRPAVRLDSSQSAVAATAMAQRPTPSPAPAATPAPVNRTLTLGGHAAAVKRAATLPPAEPPTEAVAAEPPPPIFATRALVPPVTLTTRKSGQGLLWTAAFAATVVAAVAIFFAVRALKTQNQQTAQPMLAGVTNTSTPPTPAIVAQVTPPAVTPIPNNTAAPAAQDEGAIIPRPVPVAVPSAVDVKRKLGAPLQVVPRNATPAGTAVPSTSTGTPVAGPGSAAPQPPADDENPAYVALVREVTDASYAKDFVRGLAAAEEGLLLRPDDLSLRFQAVLMACQANNAVAAKRNFAEIHNAQTRAGIEQACIAFSDIELTAETKYTAAYKSKKANELYMEGAKAAQAGDQAAAAKLFEKSFELNPIKSNDAAVWQGAMAACRAGNEALFRKFWPHVAARFKDDVIKACQKADVVIPGIVEAAPL